MPPSRSALLLLILLAGCQAGPPPSGRAASVKPPKLVVPILIDGLGMHQVAKHASRYGEGGFKRLLEEGAWYADARYGHSTTITAVGHGTWLTGAYPYRHGMISNDWYDRKEKRIVYCTEDPAHHNLGEPDKNKRLTEADKKLAGGGTSPKNLPVTTVGDELRVATDLKSRVFAVSMKDRGAILPAGHLGIPYFYSTQTGRFISTTFYLEEFPEWWGDFHRSRPQDRWFGKEWTPLLADDQYAGAWDEQEARNDARNDFSGLGKEFPHKLSGSKKKLDASYYAAMEGSPFGHEYLSEFAKVLITREGLGKNPDGAPDLVAISFSSHDLINHTYGPESTESLDDLLRLDRTLADFFKFLDGWVGLENVLISLTADHGFSYTPEYWKNVMKADVMKIDAEDMLKKLNEHLGAKFGLGKFAAAWKLPTVWLDYDLIDERKLSRAEVERVSAEFLSGYPGVQFVFTRTQLSQGLVPRTRVGQMVSRSWNSQVSGDLLLIQKDGSFFKEPKFNAAAMHGTPWTYDTRVPVMFLGRSWVKGGQYLEKAEPADIAPTLSQILGVPPPSGSEGRALSEMLK
jgi:hypothetical protein